MNSNTIYYIHSIFNSVQYVLLVRAFFFVLFVGWEGRGGGRCIITLGIFLTTIKRLLGVKRMERRACAVFMFPVVGLGVKL